MTAFDTDVLTDIAKRVPQVLARAAAVPPDERFVPVVVAEEALRGQLATVRSAQSGSVRIKLEQAYAYLEETLRALKDVQMLSYTNTADALFVAWRTAKLKVGVQDLRIAAICVAHGAKLVTRNARDYAQVPGLNFEVWS